MERITRLSLCVGLLTVDSILLATKFTHDNYFGYLPPMAPIGRQTEASTVFHLYGNKEAATYRDDDFDGIDDERAKRLLEMAEMFSPVLRRNTFSVPRDVEAMLCLTYEENSMRNVPDYLRLHLNKEPILYVDSWGLARPGGQRIRTDSINLSLAETHSPTCTAGVPCNHLQAHYHDLRLKSLLDQYVPNAASPVVTAPNQQSAQVLYFDFEGKDERSWNHIYRKLWEREQREVAGCNSRIYAHFFICSPERTFGQISQSEKESMEQQYEFVIQYWMFYPFNDSVNNHEGDWEHINVRMTTLERKHRLLRHEDISRILDSSDSSILDSLVIRSVDYYFHRYVMTVDYVLADLDFYEEDRKKFTNTLKNARQGKLRQDWLFRRVYERIHLHDGTINTHPIGYIGGDNMGLDQVFAIPGDKNRNSHGTYPFPGVWRLGKAGATEKITGERIRHVPVPPVRTRRSELSSETFSAKEIPRASRYLTYSRNTITLLPDWERVHDLALSNISTRRKWAWLLLPIRWGFPVADSPMAGALEYADLGNVAPVGPAYNSGWNDIDDSTGFERYDPHILISQFKTGLQDNFHSSWGFLNLTLPTLISLPGTNMLWTVSGGRLEHRPKFYSRTDIPFRFYSLAWKPFAQSRDDRDFAQLLPQEEHPLIASALAGNATIDASSFEHRQSQSFLRFMFNQHIGNFSSENALSGIGGKVSYDVVDANEKTTNVKGDLELWELTGSFRWNLSQGSFQPFLRSGYGWSWYRVNNVVFGDQLLQPSPTEWYHNPTWPPSKWNSLMPNTFHFGGGVEWFPYKNKNLWRVPYLSGYILDPNFGMPDLGFRADYTFYRHRLGSDVPNGRGNAGIVRREVTFGLVIGL